MREKIILTEAGFMVLKARLASLEKKLQDLRLSKGEAAEAGGNEWHDNAAFEEAEQKERMFLASIREAKSKIANAKVIKQGRRTIGVGIGTRVKVELENQELEIEVLGHGEGSPADGKIAYDSPLGKAIANKKEGNTGQVTVENEKKKVIVKIINKLSSIINYRL